METHFVTLDIGKMLAEWAIIIAVAIILIVLLHTSAKDAELTQ